MEKQETVASQAGWAWVWTTWRGPDLQSGGVLREDGEPCWVGSRGCFREGPVDLHDRVSTLAKT